MRIRFTQEARLSTFSDKGPGVRIFKPDDSADLDDVAARMFIGAGKAEPAAKPKAKAAKPKAAAAEGSE